MSNKKTKLAVILAGCGHLDGAEIRESVLTLLAIENLGINYQIFSIDKDQHHVINHLTGETTDEKRNMMQESARIARGNVRDISELKTANYDGIILPGGFGVAKNFCDIAFKGSQASIHPEIKKIINNFYQEKKPIGAICISPALVALAIANSNIKYTLGDNNNNNEELISQSGGKYCTTKIGETCFDHEHKIFTCAAYMRNAPLPKIYQEISEVIKNVVNCIN
jgi:enhancing lycopene biosynthesis protein 2